MIHILDQACTLCCRSEEIKHFQKATCSIQKAGMFSHTTHRTQFHIRYQSNICFVLQITRKCILCVPAAKTPISDRSQSNSFSQVPADITWAKARITQTTHKYVLWVVGRRSHATVAKRYWIAIIKLINSKRTSTLFAASCALRVCSRSCRTRLRKHRDRCVIKVDVRAWHIDQNDHSYFIWAKRMMWIGCNEIAHILCETDRRSLLITRLAKVANKGWV